jgi:hypothetical protein
MGVAETIYARGNGYAMREQRNRFWESSVGYAATGQLLHAGSCIELSSPSGGVANTLHI